MVWTWDEKESGVTLRGKYNEEVKQDVDWMKQTAKERKGRA